MTKRYVDRDLERTPVQVIRPSRRKDFRVEDLKVQACQKAVTDLEDEEKGPHPDSALPDLY